MLLVACGGGGGGGGSNGSPAVASSSSSAHASSASSASSAAASSTSASSSSSSSSTVYVYTYGNTQVKATVQKLPIQISGKTYNLETKFYIPQDGNSVHPLLVMTHGRNGPTAPINPNETFSYDPFNVAVAAQGYRVLHLVRRGYGNSDGPDGEYLDTPEASAYAGAEDVQATVAYLRANAAAFGINPAKIVTAGHSQGGWVILAAATLDMPGVLGAVNMSGATNSKEGTQCNSATYLNACNEAIHKRAAGVFGASNKRPIFWAYASNDNHSVATITDWYGAYTSAGGKGSLFFTAPYTPCTGCNGHTFNNQPSLYLTDLMSFFSSIGFK